MFENPNHNAILLLVIACIVVISLLVVAFIGAYRLFLGASDGTGIGITVYFALWIFFFPVMLIISLVAGALWLVIYSWASWDEFWTKFSAGSS